MADAVTRPFVYTLLGVALTHKRSEPPQNKDMKKTEALETNNGLNSILEEEKACHNILFFVSDFALLYFRSSLRYALRDRPRLA